MARILVVENNDLVLPLVVKVLKRAGHDVQGVLNPREADAASRHFRPALAVLDLELGDPERNGITLFQVLRRSAPGLAGIVMTGYGTMATGVECGRVGIAKCLQKPFKARELLAAIDDTLPDSDAQLPAELEDDGNVSEITIAPDLAVSLRNAEDVLDLLRRADREEPLEVARQVVPRLLDVVTDVFMPIPIILTCGGPTARIVLARERTEPDLAAMADLAISLARSVALERRPRQRCVIETLAVLKAAAIGGDAPREEDLAKRFAMDPTNLGRTLKAATDHSWPALACGARLQLALPGIIRTLDPVSQVAYTAGYANDRQLRRDFRAVFGIAPGHLRRALWT